MKDINETEFVIADWHVIPAKGELVRDTERIHLEPKVMEVLVYMVSRKGEVITREELERDVWHGAVVGYDSMSATIIKLRKALHDNARQPRFISTIPKRGYQLIAPVEYLNKVQNTNLGPRKVKDKPKSQEQVKVKSGSLLYVFVLFIAAFLVIFLITTQQDVMQSESLPTLVVLPFENLGVNVSHDVFADGMTEDIVTDLSRVSSLLVMASNTSFRYKGQQITVKEIAQELKVDFVLKGNIRRTGDVVRINVQLINAKTGFNTWASRYDKNLDKVFGIQDDVINSVVEALAIKMTSLEKQRLKHNATLNLDAYDLFQEGQKISKISTRESHEQARVLYRKAIDIDPTYGRAYGATAYSLAFSFRRGWSDTPIETLDRALALAEQAVALDDSIPQTYWALGYVYLMRKEFDKAKKITAQAITIAPNYADGYGLLSLINKNMGYPEKAIKLISKGMLLNPFYTWDYPYNLGSSYYMLGNYKLAISELEKAQERNENAIPIKLYLAASYIKARRQDDAEWTVEQLLALNPTLTIEHTDKTLPLVESKFKSMLLKDLRLAGVPK